MPEIRTDGKPLDVNANMNIPAKELPCFRTLVAVERGIQNKILIHTWGGIGDYLCAEPAVRFACEKFKDTEIYLATYTPEFFTHLPLAKVFNLRENEIPVWEDYYLFQTIYCGDSLHCQFLTHLYSQVVDYHTLAMWRVQLPCADRCIQLPQDKAADAVAVAHINPATDVLIHAGRTWPSRTFSKEWWDGVITHVIRFGGRPVLIGAESLNNCGTVDVNPEDCLDLRGKLSLMESVAVTHRAKVLLTNDSSPIHMAAPGKAWVGFVSTVRHPDTLMHYRNGGEFGWRQKNFSLGWVIQGIDCRPSNPELIRFDLADPSPWLPKPEEYAEWAVQKLNE